MEAMDADFTVFAGSLASAVADEAERRRSTVPKPNASIQAWRDLGVNDDALFPDEYLSRVVGMHHQSAIVPDPHEYTQKMTWENKYCPTIGAHRAVSALLVVVMTEPPNQFQFLTALLRLAQSPESTWPLWRGCITVYRRGALTKRITSRGLLNIST
ncbi:hypothetical protein BDZ89DRAFT_195667 [Hymenopellis radicata]|nr:hypothetical protein BDZ89DRAFT_195667 [Hymenopellis radicata]